MKYKEEIERLYADGKTYNQIKELLGCSKGTISYYLGDGQKEKNNQRKRDRRTLIAKHLQQVKQESPCADCRESYPYWMMEFDHLGDKTFTISDFRRTTDSLEIVKREIAKCEVVCANCHKNRTHMRALRTGHATLDVSGFYE